LDRKERPQEDTHDTTKTEEEERPTHRKKPISAKAFRASSLPFATPLTGTIKCENQQQEPKLRAI